MTPWPFDPLRPFQADGILADPPWAYEMYSDAGHGKSPEAHYDTMDEQALLRLPVRDLASRTALMVMWAIWPKLPFAIELMQAWGFHHVTGGAWHKKTRHGKTAFGTGYVLRSSCEPFLVGKLGEVKTASKSVRNLIEAEAREHSRKPPAMRGMCEKLLPMGQWVELFAREPWPGQAVWGNETGKFASAQEGAP